MATANIFFNKYLNFLRVQVNQLFGILFCQVFFHVGNIIYGRVFYQQAEQLRSDLGLDTKGTRRMIATWVFRKYIVKVEAGELYRKLCFLKKESK